MINLKIYEKTFRPINRGISTKFSFKIGKQEFFFKEDFSNLTHGHIPNHVVEILCSRILKKVGCVNFVTYDIAEFDGNIGCVSKSFKQQSDAYEIDFLKIMLHNYVNKTTNQTLPLDNEFEDDIYKEFFTSLNDDPSMYAMSIDTVIKDIEFFCANNNLVFDKEKTFKELTQTVVSDYFFCNPDRSWYNISFLINNRNHIRPVPIFDNGMSFGLQNFPDTPSNYLLLGISEIGTKEALNENNILKNNGLIVADILQLSQNDTELRAFVDNFLRLDIEKEINELKNEIEVTDFLKERIVRLYKQRQEHFNLTKQKIEKRIKTTTTELDR